MTQSKSTATNSANDTFDNPALRVRKIIEEFVSDEILPESKSFELYYVRGVSYGISSEDNAKESVIYQPEFVYLLDVGFPAIPAVSIGTAISGLGDPRFPNFSQREIHTVLRKSARDIIFPVITGKLIIGVQPGTTEQVVINALTPFCESVRKLSTDTYIAATKPFFEPETIRNIQESVTFVRYVETNRKVRIIDFEPGWLIDRIC